MNNSHLKDIKSLKVEPVFAGKQLSWRLFSMMKAGGGRTQAPWPHTCRERSPGELAIHSPPCNQHNLSSFWWLSFTLLKRLLFAWFNCHLWGLLPPSANRGLALEALPSLQSTPGWEFFQPLSCAAEWAHPFLALPELWLVQLSCSGSNSSPSCFHLASLLVSNQLQQSALVFRLLFILWLVCLHLSRACSRFHLPL